MHVVRRAVLEGFRCPSVRSFATKLPGGPSAVFGVRRPLTTLQSNLCAKPRANSTRAISPLLLRQLSRAFSFDAQARLSQFTNVELLAKEEPRVIQKVWEQYFTTKPKSFGFTMTTTQFSKLRRRASVNNFFLFPIRGVGEHSDKYIVVLANYSAQNDTCNFTGLDHFRTFGENAPPYMVLSFFTEFKENKGLVLMRGDIINEKELFRPGAMRLFKLLEHFYTDDAHFDQWVKQFNQQADRFSFDDYLKALPEIEDELGVRVLHNIPPPPELSQDKQGKGKENGATTQAAEETK